MHWGLVVDRALEEQNVRLRLVDLVVFPSQTLSNSQSSPLVLPQQLEGASRTVKVFLGYRLEHLLGQLDVSVLEVVVGVSRRVVNALDELVQALALRVAQRARLLVAARSVNVHVSHCERLSWVGAEWQRGGLA